MHHDTDITWLIRECACATSFALLAPIAVSEIRKFPDGAEIVCGPITTGGRGSPQANVEVFDLAISRLTREGYPIFSQIPYEEQLFLLRERWMEEDDSRKSTYCWPILHEFYAPIFATSLVRRAWFLPDWETSTGAKWEHEELTACGASIVYLSRDWVEELFAHA